MSVSRHKAEIRRVRKHGDAYLVEGVSEGREKSFWVSAESVERMGKDAAQAFFRRSVRNLTHPEESEHGTG